MAKPKAAPAEVAEGAAPAVPTRKSRVIEVREDIIVVETVGMSAGTEETIDRDALWGEVINPGDLYVEYADGSKNVVAA